MKVYLGADHKGFELKEKIKQWFDDYEWYDLGNLVYDQNDDYTTYAKLVAQKIQEDKNSLGILLCGSGVGVDIVANKFDGVRSSIGKNIDQVKAGRNDDNMNVLVIAADFTKDKEAQGLIKAFLKTKFANKERFNKRLNDIKKIEKTN